MTIVNNTKVKVSNSEFLVLAAILLPIGGIGIYEGNLMHPVFYTQPVIIFGGLGCFAYQSFYMDRKQASSASDKP
jgi:hypothetical protein